MTMDDLDAFDYFSFRNCAQNSIFYWSPNFSGGSSILYFEPPHEVPEKLTSSLGGLFQLTLVRFQEHCGHFLGKSLRKEVSLVGGVSEVELVTVCNLFLDGSFPHTPCFYLAWIQRISENIKQLRNWETVF